MKHVRLEFQGTHNVYLAGQFYRQQSVCIAAPVNQLAHGAYLNYQPATTEPMVQAPRSSIYIPAANITPSGGLDIASLTWKLNK
jgi:hypothetical protein